MRRAGRILLFTGCAVIAAFLVGMIVLESMGSRPLREDDTQVIAQWLDRDSATWGYFDGILSEIRIDLACGELCAFDGNDIGSGTYNMYLYTGDVSGTVALLKRMELKGDIPMGVRIGVRRYTNASHTDWTYEAVHPVGLREFRIMYPTPSNP